MERLQRALRSQDRSNCRRSLVSTPLGPPTTQRMEVPHRGIVRLSVVPLCSLNPPSFYNAPISSTLLRRDWELSYGPVCTCLGSFRSKGMGAFLIRPESVAYGSSSFLKHYDPPRKHDCIRNCNPGDALSCAHSRAITLYPNALITVRPTESTLCCFMRSRKTLTKPFIHRFADPGNTEFYWCTIESTPTEFRRLDIWEQV